MNAIVGPNGSGKSNLLTGIYGAITGDFGRNEGTLGDNIRDTADPSAASSVRAVFSHNGLTAEAFRSLRPAGRRLVIGDGIWTADRDFKDRMAGFLAVDATILDKYVFVEQWDVFGVFDETPAKRAAAFQRLFGLEKASKVFQAVDAESKRVVVPNVPSVAEARDRFEACRVLHDRATADLAGLRPTAVVVEEMRQVDAGKAALGEQARLTAELQRLSAALTQHTAEEADRKAAFESARQTADQVVPAAQRMAVLYAETEAAWAAVSHARQTFDTYQQHAAAARKRLADAEARWGRAQAGVPTAPAGFLDGNGVVQAEARLRHLQHRIAATQGLLATFDPAKNLAACPTCGTLVAAMKDHLDAARAENEQAKREAAPLDALIRASKAYVTAYQLHTNELQNAAREKDAAGVQMTGLGAAPAPPPPDPPHRLDVLKASRDEHQRHAENALRLVREKETEVQAAVRRAADTAAALEQTAQALDRALAAVPKGVTSVELTARSVALAGELSVRDTAVQTESGLHRELDTAAAALSAAEAAGRAAAVAGSWLLRTERQKAIFHPRALPQTISDKYLRGMVDGVNGYLSEFRAPFHCEAGSDLTLTAVFPGGIRRPAGRLSGGQKVVLGLAFRLTVNETFASQLGLLCLDEPTVGLDAHNMTCLVSALERLGRLAQDSGLQVVMVTHARELTGTPGLFDKVISFYK